MNTSSKTVILIFRRGKVVARILQTMPRGKPWRVDQPDDPKLYNLDLDALILEPI
jgi:hypothetical protein